MFERKKIAMVVAELLGTSILTAVVLAMIKFSFASYFVAIAAGLMVGVGVLLFGSISGAHLNPLVTIGLLTARRIKVVPAIVYIAAQLLGGFVAYLLFSYLIDAPLTNTGDYDPRILVGEAAGAFVFALGWAAAVYNKLDESKSAFIIGASFAIGIIVASIASPSLVNPAVALGTHSWVWGTYVLGPILGGIIGFNLYALLFAPASALIAEAKATKK